MLAIGCALAMLAAGAAIAPAFAGAQAAVDEYQLGELPNPDNDGGSQSTDGDDQGGVVPTSSSGSGTPSGPAGEGAGGGGGTGDDTKSDRGKENAGESGAGSKGDNIAATPTDSEQVRAVNAEASDGGGAPVLLILLAIVAALCTGVAIWRLRRNNDESDPEVGRSTEDSNKGVGRGPGKTAETQSL